jgi:hypothetical protein
VYLDFSGDAATRRRVHEAAGDRLKHSAVIGATHWKDTAAGGGPLPGPEPTLFFAPTHVAALSEELGREELAHRIDQAWSAFADRAEAGSTSSKGTARTPCRTSGAHSSTGPPPAHRPRAALARLAVRRRAALGRPGRGDT